MADIWEPDLNGKRLPALIRESLNDEGVPRLFIQTLRMPFRGVRVLPSLPGHKASVTVW